MEQKDLDYFEKRFDKLEVMIDKHGDRIDTLEATTSRHTQIFTATGALSLASFTAWVSSLFHK